MKKCPLCLEMFKARVNGKCPHCDWEVEYVGYRKKRKTVTKFEKEKAEEMVIFLQRLISKNNFTFEFYGKEKKKQISVYYDLIHKIRETLILNKLHNNADDRQCFNVLQMVLEVIFGHKRFDWLRPRIDSFTAISNRTLREALSIVLTELQAAKRRKKIQKIRKENKSNIESPMPL